jgi:uncharacterized membrane protein YedE/YeeE
MMENFTPISALIGGALIGLSAGLLWIVNGRIAGIAGILGNIAPVRENEVVWRVVFLVALAVGAGLAWHFGPALLPTLAIFTPTQSTPLGLLVVAGLLVGVGTRLSNGCTSGHGVCGLARLSPRSLAAVITFMLLGIVTVTIVRHVI